jgi:hypothetical protein
MGTITSFLHQHKDLEQQFSNMSAIQFLDMVIADCDILSTPNKIHNCFHREDYEALITLTAFITNAHRLFKQKNLGTYKIDKEEFFKIAVLASNMKDRSVFNEHVARIRLNAQIIKLTINQNTMNDNSKKKNDSSNDYNSSSHDNTNMQQKNTNSDMIRGEPSSNDNMYISDDNMYISDDNTNMQQKNINSDMIQDGSSSDDYINIKEPKEDLAIPVILRVITWNRLKKSKSPLRSAILLQFPSGETCYIRWSNSQGKVIVSTDKPPYKGQEQAVLELEFSKTFRNQRYDTNINKYVSDFDKLENFTWFFTDRNRKYYEKQYAHYVYRSRYNSNEEFMNEFIKYFTFTTEVVDTATLTQQNNRHTNVSNQKHHSKKINNYQTINRHTLFQQQNKKQSQLDDNGVKEKIDWLKETFSEISGITISNQNNQQYLCIRVYTGQMDTASQKIAQRLDGLYFTESGTNLLFYPYDDLLNGVEKAMNQTSQENQQNDEGYCISYS